MGSLWQHILHECGARLEEGLVTDFGDPGGEASAAQHGGVIAHLSELAVIQVAGEDAESFLSGQLTSDVQALAPGRSQLGAWCSPQGRVIALFRIVRLANAFWLLLPRDLIDATLKRLRMYVLRARVSLAEGGKELLSIGVSGPAALATSSSLVAVPQTADEVTLAQGVTAIRLPDRRPRLLLLGEPELLASFWQDAIARLRPVGALTWRLLDIEAGLPQVYAVTRDRFLPQMLNLDVLGGLSFSKGCYPGQEIIARLKYRGQLKQRLYLGHADTNDVPVAGVRLAVADQEAAAGEVVMAAPHPDGGCALTAVMQMELVGTGRIHLYDVNGPAVRFSPPPYDSA
ncbi:MAG: CAF17-like 4Fe-4S cluster assembly/insertion protein YgfZ [Chromatiales bacterium]